MLIRCQNSLRCSMTDIHQSLIQSEDENNSRFSGRYFAYSTLSSVNMPCTPSAHPEPHLSNRPHHVCPFQTQSALHKADDLFEVTISLV